MERTKTYNSRPRIHGVLAAEIREAVCTTRRPTPPTRPTPRRRRRRHPTTAPPCPRPITSLPSRPSSRAAATSPCTRAKVRSFRRRAAPPPRARPAGCVKRARWGAQHRIHEHFADGFPDLARRFVKVRASSDRRFEYDLGTRRFPSKHGPAFSRGVRPRRGTRARRRLGAIGVRHLNARVRAELESYDPDVNASAPFRRERFRRASRARREPSMRPNISRDRARAFPKFSRDDVPRRRSSAGSTGPSARGTRRSSTCAPDRRARVIATAP